MKQKPRKYKSRRGSTKKDRALRMRLKYPTASLTEIGQRAGYNAAPRQAACRALSSQEAKSKIREAMQAREGLRLPALARKLEEGMQAEKITRAVEDGKFSDEKRDPDYQTRHRYLETAAKWYGVQSTEGESGGGVTDLAVLLGITGGDGEKSEMANIMIAVRIKRGLHPQENRPLTEGEAEQWRTKK